MDCSHPMVRCVCERKRYVKIFWIGIGTSIFQGIMSWHSGSLALLTDALHAGIDAFGYGIAIIAEKFITTNTFNENQEKHVRAKFGSISALLLLGTAVYIFLDALERSNTPPPIESALMITGAAVGVKAGIAALLILHGVKKRGLSLKRWIYINAVLLIKHLFSEDHGVHETHEWNHRHIVFDLFISCTVLIGALAIHFTGANNIDVYCSFILAILIFVSTVYHLLTKTRKNMFHSPS